MSKRRGFTLIELLVVISIIALLLSILMPSLKKVKQVAQAVVCSSNTRQLTLAWQLYAGDNNDKMCFGNVFLNGTYSEQWVQRIAQPGDPGYVAGLSALEREGIGIENGCLFPYTQNIKVYHCPTDPAYKKYRGLSTLPAETKRSPYRTFTIACCMNGGPSPGSTIGYSNSSLVKKIGQIKSPSSKYVFLEEAEEGKGGHNWGSWMLLATADSWWDPVSVWHGGRTVLGFVDGHAETHLWQNDSTIDLANGIIGPGDFVNPNDDLRWMQKGYVQQ